MSVLRIACIGILSATGCGVAGAGDRLFIPGIGKLWRYDLASGVGTVVVDGVNTGIGAACSADGYVFFSNLAEIERWDQDGGSHAVIRLPALVPGFEPPSPTGLAFDPAGDLYINTGLFPPWPDGAGAFRLAGGDPANVPEQVIPPFARGGRGAATVAGGPHAGAILFATGDEVVISEPPGAPVRVLIDSSQFEPRAGLEGLATNSCGEVFVGVCSMSHGCRVERFDPEGGFIEVYAAGVFGADGLAFDSEGNLFIATSPTGTLWRVAPDRTRTRYTDFVIGLGAPAMCLEPLACAAGGPYLAECAGETTCLALQADVPERPCTSLLWTSDCPGADFAGSDTSPSPTLCLSSAGCTTRCSVSLTFTEGLRSAQCSAEVVVEDTADPLLTGVPVDETVECDAVPAPAEPVAVDVCDPAPRLGFDEARTDGRCADQYRLTRTWTATDHCGHSTSEAQVLSVVDTSPPLVSAWLEPAAPARPRSAASARSACSGPASAGFHVRCSAADACDPAPELTARLLVTHHDVREEDGPCTVRTDEVAVACDEPIEVRLVAPPCPAKPPKAPRSSLSVSSQGIKLVTGEEVVLRVTGLDRCGNEGQAEFDPARDPSPGCEEELEDGTCCPSLMAPPAGRCRLEPCAGG